VPDIEIAERYFIDRSTVNHIFDEYTKNNDFYYVKPKSGYSRKFTTNDVCIAVRMLANTQAHNVTDIQRQQFPNLHPDTIRKRLATCGLKAYVCHKKPFLFLAYKIKWLEWAKAHQHC
jgi:Transposase.